MTSIAEHISNFLTVFLDSASAWFFCCVISIFILPLILDRIIFFIPKLIVLSKNEEVYYRSILFTSLETVLWAGAITGVYIVLFKFQPFLFGLVTDAVPALLSWVICLIFLLRRFINFDRTIKRDFYYEVYMRYIKPEALSEYMIFLEELDSLELAQIDDLATKPLRYMHKQAVLRKQKEINMR